MRQRDGGAANEAQEQQPGQGRGGEGGSEAEEGGSKVGEVGGRVTERD